MVDLFIQALPFTVLVFHIVLAILFIALLAYKSWGRGVSLWVGRHVIGLGLLISAMAISGSIFYSNIVGFEPCLLCWWQRIAIYPLLILFSVALVEGDRAVFKYVLPLSIVGATLASYHSYVQWGGSPLIPCDVTASCSKLYVYAFGYITIPTMSLSVAVFMVLLWWSNKVYENRNA